MEIVLLNLDVCHVRMYFSTREQTYIHINQFVFPCFSPFFFYRYIIQGVGVGVGVKNYHGLDFVLAKVIREWQDIHND